MLRDLDSFYGIFRFLSTVFKYQQSIDSIYAYSKNETLLSMSIDDLWLEKNLSMKVRYV